MATIVKPATSLSLLVVSSIVVFPVMQPVWGVPDALPARGAHQGTYKYAKLKPVRLQEVVIRDDYWQQRIDRSRDIGVLDYLKKSQQAGYIENFRIVAKNLEKRHIGGPNNNEFVYKLMEAAGHYAHSNPELAEAFRKLNELVLAAQCEDGYLNTYYENPLIKKNGKKRFQSTNRFEFYNFGHFTLAAIAWHRMAGDDDLLRAAIRFADLIVEKFATPKRLPYKLYQGPPNKKYEHPNHEMAMVELYRVTGEKRYLDFARQTLNEYKFWDFKDIWGHAVQETLLMTGGADLYLECGEPKMMQTLKRLWTDMHERKMYVTGGVGSTGAGEAYGGPYELPNETAYAETCAAISMVFWNYRMLLATGESKYADCMERALYNAVLSGISLNGTEYFYRNPLQYDPAKKRSDVRRKPFYACSCCPPNVHRLLGSLQQYIYTRNNEGIQVHLYIGSALQMKLACGTEITLTQHTRCPWDSVVRIVVEPQREANFTLRLRIPGWSGNKGGPDALYRYIVQNAPEENRTSMLLQVNGRDFQPEVEKGYATIARRWKRGDIITLDIPMPVRRVLANEKVEANRGLVAVQRGPIVYCIEAIDNDGDISDIELPDSGRLKAEFREDLLDGVMVLTGEAHRMTFDEHGQVAGQKRTPVTLIPYSTWAHRGQCQMSVWIRRGQTD